MSNINNLIIPDTSNDVLTMTNTNVLTIINTDILPNKNTNVLPNNINNNDNIDEETLKSYIENAEKGCCNSMLFLGDYYEKIENYNYSLNYYIQRNNICENDDLILKIANIYYKNLYDLDNALIYFMKLNDKNYGLNIVCNSIGDIYLAKYFHIRTKHKYENIISNVFYFTNMYGKYYTKQQFEKNNIINAIEAQQSNEYYNKSHEYYLKTYEKYISCDNIKNLPCEMQIINYYKWNEEYEKIIRYYDIILNDNGCDEHDVWQIYYTAYAYANLEEYEKAIEFVMIADDFGDTAKEIAKFMEKKKRYNETKILYKIGHSYNDDISNKSIDYKKNLQYGECYWNKSKYLFAEIYYIDIVKNWNDFYKFLLIECCDSIILECKISEIFYRFNKLYKSKIEKYIILNSLENKDKHIINEITKLECSLEIKYILAHENAEKDIENTQQCCVCLNNTVQIKIFKCVHSTCINCVSHILICPLCREERKNEFIL
jgi:tetratricopeptide (TPR) repeat protein